MSDDEGVSTKAEGFALGFADSSEQLYRNVYETAPLAFVLWDRQCRVTDWNRRAEMMFGWSREEVLGQNFFELLIPVRARPRVEAMVATLLQGLLPSRSINENLTKSGEVILCEWNNTIRRDKNGRVVGAMSLGLDITARKKAEEALRESEERLSLIANNLPVLIGYVDTDQIYRFANKEYVNWFGLEPAEIVGKKVKDFLGDEVYEQVRDHVNKVLSGQFVMYESTLPLRDGTIRPFLARYVPHRNKRGDLSGFFVLVEDISERKKSEEALKEAHDELERRVVERTHQLTAANIALEHQIEERKRIEEELRSSERKYRTLIDQASDAIVICSADGKVMDANRRALSLFGYTKEELTQRRFTDLHPTGDFEKYVSAFQEALREGSGSLSDGIIVTKGGVLVPVDITGSAVQLGDKIVFQGLFRDVTERRRTEEVVRNIAEGVAASTGEAFFQSLVSHLAGVLDMDYAFVGELISESQDTLATLAVWTHDHIADNFVYPLAHSPCQNVGGKICCCHPRDVREQFPLDEMLAELRIECYVGVPLFDSDGRPIGLMAVMDGKPAPHPQLVESTLRVFAARASAELERKRAEEALRESEKDLRFLSAELLSAQENERARIARELHDGIGQSLGTLKMRVETLVQLAKSGDGRADLEHLSSLVPLIQKTMEEVRNTSMDLRPSTLDTLGILATIAWFCREFRITFPSLHVEKKIDLNEDDVPDSLKTVLYRILQEVFNNIAKHSGADRVSLSLARKEGRITLTVEDNGAGFDLAAVKDLRVGLGLTSLRERTELSGGSFSIESEPGKGTTVRASWPL